MARIQTWLDKLFTRLFPSVDRLVKTVCEEE